MSEWEYVQIGSICDVGDGAHTKVNRQKMGIPYLTSKNFSKGSLKLDVVDFISEDDYENLFSKASKAITRPQKNDVLMSIIGTFGNGYKYKENDVFGISSSIAILRPNQSKVDADFLEYVINSKAFENTHKAYSSGSVQGYSNIPTIKKIPIFLPPLKTQRDIVGILRALDAKIENLGRQNENLEQIAQTLFKHWFIDFEFPNADGKPYKSSGGAIVASELGDIPEGWKFSTIGDEVETVGGTPSTTEPNYWENGDIPWYSPTDLTKAKTLFSIDSEKKITKLGLQKSSAKLFPKYSLLLTSRATIGEVTINTKEACTNQGFITIIPNTKFSVYFLYGWLLTKIGVIKQLASGSTFPEISKTNFRGLDFLIPASNILEKYEPSTEPIYKKIETNIFQIEILTKTRDSLLPKLMSGKLRVKE